MNKQKGFTLIEMLVVVAIVGLLSGVVVVGLSGSREKARDARRVADIRQLQNELETQYSASTGYPATEAFEPGLDPSNDPYFYEAVSPEGVSSNTSYNLGACLETPELANEGTCPSAMTACANQFCVNP